MRLFVAVDLSPEAIEEAAGVADDIRRRAPDSKLRWVPPPNMHLTVRFLGQVAESVDALIVALTQPISVDPFDLTLGGCGAFPPAGAVRVVWIGLAAGAPQLAQISAIIDARVTPFGFEPEARPYSPHLTLARADRHARAPRRFRDTLAAVAIRPVVTHVERAIVYRSHLSPRGARYEPLAAIAFDGQTPAGQRSRESG
jgi:RNA 2',3'-cyclic 3'-phosphodiesterase